MLKSILCLILSLGFVLFTYEIRLGQVWAASIEWDGGASTTNWEDALNWSTDTVPGSGDDVLIDSDVTVDLNSSTTINSLVLGNSGGTTTPTLNFAYDAVGGSPLIIDDGDVVMYSGSEMTHSASGSGIVGRLDIEVQTGDFTVHSGASIDADGKGYSASNGNGQGGDGETNYNSAGGGAGHGGYGANSNEPGYGGPIYDDFDNPLLPGSGGGNAGTATGGRGGGVVKITLTDGELILDGTITAQGNQGSTVTGGKAGGGGSGGSINIDCDTFTAGSTASISVKGGNAISVTYSQVRYSGEGGGGLVYIEYSDITVDDSTVIDVNSGIPAKTYGHGSGGILTWQDKDNAYPDLEIHDGNWYPGNLSVDNYDFTSPLSLNSLTVTDNAIVDFESGSNVNIIENLTLTNNGLVYLKSGGSLDLGGSTVWNTGGALIDQGGSFPLLTGTDLYVPTGAIYYADTTRSYQDGEIYGTLTHSVNGSSFNYKIDLTFSGNVDIYSGGAIDVEGKGYTAGNGDEPGATGDSNANSAGGGGGHGGIGGQGWAYNGFELRSGGGTYDTEEDPQLPGSGGGTAGDGGGGAGGGVILLDIAGYLNLHEDGYISAKGADGNAGTTGRVGGGGAGGTVNIYANSLIGDEATYISANGGDGASQDYSAVNHSGAGGGGRIDLSYGGRFSGDISVTGGVGGQVACNGGDGTDNIVILNSNPDLATIQSAGDFYASKATTVVAKYSDSDGKDDLDKLYIHLDVEGSDEDVEYYADEIDTNSTGLTPTNVSGTEYIESITYDIYPITDGSYVVNDNELIVVWHIVPTWNWIDEMDIEVGLKSIDDSAADSGYTYTNSDYSYENDLTFTGTLTVVNEESDTISSGDWVLPEEELTWSGLTVVYQGTTDIYPNDDDFNVTVTDDDSNSWVDGISSGTSFSITSTAQESTTTEDIHTITITDIPTGGTDVSSQTFTIKVDADDPEITSLSSTTHITPTNWYNLSNATFQLEYSDVGSDVSTVYSYITSNSGETEEDILSEGTELTETEWTIEDIEDGEWYIHVLVVDGVGNIDIESLKFNIDISIPDIVDITGSSEGVWQNIDSGPTISWTDPLSISDDFFYITTEGTDPNSQTFEYATNKNTYNLPNLGEGEHTVKVISKNGAGTYSEVRTFLVRYDSTGPNTVSNLSATVSSNNTVNVTWSNPVSDFNNVILVRKINSASTSVSDGTQIYTGNASSYTDTGLASKSRYYYTIWAYDALGNSSLTTSTNVRTNDIVAPSSVVDLIASQDGNSVNLTWVNPSDSDFSYVILKRNGTNIYEGSNQVYTDSLDTEGIYTYSIVAYDDSNNPSVGLEYELDFVLEVEEDENVTVMSEDKREQSSSEKIVVKESEVLEIRIPVSNILKDNDIDSIDIVVLVVDDTEYEMTLSDDRRYYTATANAPSVKGEHVITAKAIKGSNIVSQLDIGVSVESEDESIAVVDVFTEYTVYIIIGLSILLLILFILLIISLSRRGKNAKT